ncbi:MAG: IS110 family transposase, partial [Thermacetogeniaceae bacterium]
MNADCAVAGFDVGKSSSQFCVLAPDGQMHLKPTKIDNNPAGLKSAINTLKKVEEALGTKPAVVLESTGHYSMRLVHLFIRNDFEVFLINPLQSHSIKNLNIRKVKTDKIDCEEIARLFFISNLQKFKMPDENVANLKILTRYHHKFAQKRVKTMNQLKSCVDQCWPGFTEIFKDIASKTALSLLHAYPNPAQLLAAPKEEVITLIKTKSRQGKNYAEKKYRDLKRCAKEALEFGAQMDALNTCIKLLVSSIQEEDEKLKQLEAEINALAIEIPAVELLKSIPGIGDKLAPTIAAEIGD